MVELLTVLATSEVFRLEPFELIRELENIALTRDGELAVSEELIDALRERRPELQHAFPMSVYRRLSLVLDRLVPDGAGVAGLAPATATITFVLGAGASKPEPSNIPTVKELLPLVLTRARSLDRDDLTKLADFCTAKEVTNIEDVLTAAQIGTFCSSKRKVLDLMDFLRFGSPAGDETPGMRRFGSSTASVGFIQDTLQVLFGLLSKQMLPAEPNAVHKAIAEYTRGRTATSIITTNYDCCMDRALGENRKDFDYKMPSDSVATTVPAPMLLKLHGSLNWFYCDTCQQVQLLQVEALVSAFRDQKMVYPVIGVCSVCGGQNRQLLVPPQALKFDVAPPLTPLLVAAQSAFKAADLIVVVGFSFAEADQYIARMVRKSMQEKPKQQMLIVDPDASVAQRLRRKFSTTIPDFDKRRIIAETSDSAEFLPGFLTKDKAERPPANESAGADSRKDVRTTPAN